MGGPIPSLGIFFFLLFLVICLYANSLNNAFIYDDNFLIAQNLYIRQPSLILRIFQVDSFYFQHSGNPGSGGYYRPLEVLSYAVDYFFWGLKPFGYRLMNIFIHALNSFLAFLLIYRLFKDRLLALLSAIFFAIHPIQVCVVSLIAGRTNLLETLFMFLSLLAFIGFSRRQRKAYYFLSLLLFVFSILSREGGLILPFFILLFAVFLGIDKKKVAVYTAPYFLVCLFYALLRWQSMPCDKLGLAGALSWQNLGFFICQAQNYLGQLVLPIGLQEAVFQQSPQLKLGLVFLSFVCIAYVSIKIAGLKNRIVIFASSFYLVGLLPILRLKDIFDYQGAISAEHYLYKPALGFFIIIAYLITGLSLKAEKFARAIMVMAICGYSLSTVALNTFYKNEWVYYKFALRVEKENISLRFNLANLYFERKMYGRAMEEAGSILAREPSAWDAYLLLGNIHNARGDTDRAIGSFRKAIKINPRCVEAFNNLALIYRLQGKDQEAEDCFRQMLLINPDYLLGLKHYCSFLVGKKSYGLALAISGRALKLDPADTRIRLSQGIALAELGYFDAAEAAIEQALRQEPGSLSFEARKNLAAVYGNRGELGKAIAAWERLSKIKPEDEEIRNNLRKARERVQGKQPAK